MQSNGAHGSVISLVCILFAVTSLCATITLDAYVDQPFIANNLQYRAFTDDVALVACELQAWNCSEHSLFCNATMVYRVAGHKYQAHLSLRYTTRSLFTCSYRHGLPQQTEWVQTVPDVLANWPTLFARTSAVIRAWIIVFCVLGFAVGALGLAGGCAFLYRTHGQAERLHVARSDSASAQQEVGEA